MSHPTPPTRPIPQEVRISAHAAEQYRSRVKPALDVDAARAELEQLRLVGELTAVEPAWANAAKPAPFYLVVSDSVALPLARQRHGVDRDHVRDSQHLHADPPRATQRLQGLQGRTQARRATRALMT